MSTPKRQFPYFSAVPEVEVKKQALENVNPGFERNESRTFEAPALAQEPQEVWYLADQNVKKDAGCSAINDRLLSMHRRPSPNLQHGQRSRSRLG